MSVYFIFNGRASCGKCSARSGHYVFNPGRPHPNCTCEILKKRERDCDGDWTAGGIRTTQEAAIDGFLERDYWLKVTQPNGDIDHDVVKVVWPEGMDHTDFHNLLEEILEDRCVEMAEKCPPPVLA